MSFYLLNLIKNKVKPQELCGLQSDNFYDSCLQNQ